MGREHRRYDRKPFKIEPRDEVATTPPWRDKLQSFFHSTLELGMLALGGLVLLWILYCTGSYIIAQADIYGWL